MNTPEILLKAADVIDERGWHQGGYIPVGVGVDRGTCKVCVIAAINVAVGYEPDAVIDNEDDGRVNAAHVLARHLGLMTLADEHESDPDVFFDAESPGSIVGDLWNDRIATSADQVTAALRECADQLSKETPAPSSGADAYGGGQSHQGGSQRGGQGWGSGSQNDDPWATGGSGGGFSDDPPF